MKAGVYFSDKTIKIRSGAFFLIAITTIGIISAGAGGYLIFTYDLAGYLLLSVGIMLTSVGGWRLINVRYLKIITGREPGFIDIIESSFKNGIKTLKVTDNYYKSVFISQEKKRIRGKYKICYSVQLAAPVGRSLLLNEYLSKKEALDTAEKIKARMKIEISSGLQSGTVSKKSENSAVEKPEEDTGIIKTVKGKETHYSWSPKAGLPDFIFMIVALYGLLIFVKKPLPELLQNQAALFLFDAFFYLMCIAVVSFIVICLAGRYFLSVGKSGISFYFYLAGRAYAEKKIKREDIGLIKHSVKPGPSFISVSPQEMPEIPGNNNTNAAENGSGPVIDVGVKKTEEIKINTDSLSIPDRYYLETVIFSG